MINNDKIELFKDVVGYEGLYKVSNFGNVVSVKTNSIMKTTPTKKGYQCICLSKNDIRYNTFVHRLVAMAFIINPENKSKQWWSWSGLKENEETEIKQMINGL